MKTKFLLGGVAGGVLLVASLVSWPALGQTPAQPKTSAVDIPLGMECVVTVETQAWMDSAPAKPDQISGFHPDYTLRGKAVHWGPDWIVLKDGTYENWISRDKVLSVRVSR